LKAIKIIVIVFIASIQIVVGQGDGPRAHLFTPTGVWAINPKFLHLEQNLLPAGNILVKGADLSINLFPTTLVHTFRIKGKFARAFAMINPGSLTARAVQSGISEELTASGFSDGFVAFELGLIGAPSLNAIEFSKHIPQFTLMGYFRYWYSGTYDSEKLINLGTNRSTFEIGTTMAIPFHKKTSQNATWLEVMPTIQLYTDNNDPARSSSANKVEQEPILIIENHLTHNLTKKLWIGADLRFQYGGGTRADGVSDDNEINILGGGLNIGYQITAPLSIFAGYDTILFGDNEAQSKMLRVSLVFAYVNLNRLQKE